MNQDILSFIAGMLGKQQIQIHEELYCSSFIQLNTFYYLNLENCAQIKHDFCSEVRRKSLFYHI